MFCMWTPQRVRIGDLAAGTVLVLDEPKVAHSLAAITGSSRLEPDMAALVRDVLDRWREMEPAQAATLACNILVRLDGKVDEYQLHRLSGPTLRAMLENLLAST
jgi:hypothetical protein